MGAGDIKAADLTGQLSCLTSPPPPLRISHNRNNILTFDFSPIDSNFCYWNFKELCYVKKFYIKCPEIENIFVFIF